MKELEITIEDIIELVNENDIYKIALYPGSEMGLYPMYICFKNPCEG